MQRFEKLNKEFFKVLPTGINKPTIEEHIRHIGLPYTWGTHIELFAIASYFQVPVYTFKPCERKWEIFKPKANANELHYPIVVDDMFSINSLHQLELYVA